MRAPLFCILSAILMMGCTSPEHGGKVEAIELVKSSTSWNGQPLPPYKKGTPEVTILRITIPPKTTLPLHTHPVINAGVLLKGELTVTTDTGQVLHLKPYDPIVEVVDTLHHGNNDGDEPAEIIVFYAGEQGDAVTVIAPEEE